MKCASIFPMNAAAESPHALFVCFRREEGDAFPPPSFYLAISAEIANLIFLDLHPVVPSGPARYHPDANKTAPSQNLTQSQWPLSSPSSLNKKQILDITAGWWGLRPLYPSGVQEKPASPGAVLTQPECPRCSGCPVLPWRSHRATFH